jgi:HAD superfamily hydrolase (TIGR01509 family)
VNKAQGSPGLVIFDCDGVLINSERIAVEIDVAVLERVGLTMTRQQVVERFVGRSASVMDAAIEAHLGHPLSPELRTEFSQLYDEAFERELEPVPGVLEALSRLDIPTCVASSSTPESLHRKLTRVGLWDHFTGRIFSAVQVANGKPAPDLFLFAADHMGVAPAQSVVVEDSRFGVQAARAAGMHAFAFASELVDPETLRGPGTTLFSDMSELPNHIRSHRSI